MSSNQTLLDVTSTSRVAALESAGSETRALDVASASRAANSNAAPSLCPRADRANPAPGNDNATSGRVPDTTPLLAHPDLVRYLRATLRRQGVAADQIDDAVAEAQVRSLAAARERGMPADLAQWKALSATIAARWAIDRRREARARDKDHAGLAGDAGAYERPTLRREQRDPVDTKRYLAVLKEQVDSGQMPDDAAEILWGEADGIPHAQIAAEVGVTETVVRKRLFRMRATFRAKLAALGMLALALVGLAAVLSPSTEGSAPAPQRVEEAAPRVDCPGVWDGGTPISKNSCAPAGRKGAVSD